MATQRKQYSAEFKARVALEALKGLKTVHELASTSGVHPTQIAHWQHRLQKKEMPEIFSARLAKREQDQEALQAHSPNKDSPFEACAGSAIRRAAVRACVGCPPGCGVKAMRCITNGWRGCCAPWDGKRSGRVPAGCG